MVCGCCAPFIELEIMVSEIWGLLTGVITCALTYGLAAVGTGHALATGERRGNRAVVVFLLALVALSVPCTLMGVGIGFAAFGHNMGSFLMAYLASGVVVFVLALARYGHAIASTKSE
jgi:hypothetical protein